VERREGQGMERRGGGVAKEVERGKLEEKGVGRGKRDEWEGGIGGSEGGSGD